MTIPAERTRAIVNTAEFLCSLIDPKETPRVPRDIREQARRLLWHYPCQFYIDQSAEALPDVWGKTECHDKRDGGEE